MKKFLSLLMLLMTAIPAINAADFTLVTEESELVAGARYVIAARYENYAMGKTQNSNNRAAVSKKRIGTTISLTDTDNVAIFTLGGKKDAWTFYDEEKNGYLYAAGSASNNYLKTSGVENTYNGKNTCKITLDADTYIAHIVFNINETYANTLVLNGTTIFSCYKAAKVSSGSNYKQLGLFKEVTSSLETPTISVPSGTYNVVQNVTLTVPEGATTVRYTTDDAVDLKEGTGYLEYSDGTTISILKSCTLRAIATDGTNFSPVATATYTMKTLAPSIAVEKESGLVTITPDAAYEASNVKIYYTTNGDTPVAGSATEYTEPFTVAKETEVKAIAVYGDFDASDIVSLNYSDIAKVIFDASVSRDFGGLSGSSGDDISNTVFEKNGISLAFTKGSSSNPPKYYNKSGEAAVRFYVDNVITISSNDYLINKVVFTTASDYAFESVESISSGTVSINGTEMTWNGINSQEASFINKKQARLTKIEVYYSEVGTASFDAPAISVPGGTYNVIQKVTLTVPEGATSVRYTTDDAVDLVNGSDFTEYVAESEITIDKSCTLRAIATDGTNFSEVASATYTMKTAAPVITAEGAVDGVFTNEDGFLNVTFTCPPYNADEVLISYEVKDEMAEKTTGTVEVGGTITVYGNATITATALYINGDFEESDPVTATYKWNNPNAITFTKTGNIVIADQDDNKFGTGGMSQDTYYTLTDDLGNEYSIYAIIGDYENTTGNTYPNRTDSELRLYATSGSAVFISNKTLNIKSVAVAHNRTAITVNGTAVNAVNGVSTWNSSTDGCHDIKIATAGGPSKGNNTYITKISITFEKVAPFDKVSNGTELLSMEAGKYYQVNVNLQGVKSHNGVLYARTVDTTVNPSEPGKDYFDSYEDSDYAQFAQHDWVAIDGLGSDYENKNITAGFVAQYDGTKLLPVNDVVPGSDETVTTNTFGVANVFYGNYENTNTNGFDYKPFFVKAKLNEVATFVAKAVAAYEIQGSGKCGVINGKGLKVEGSDLTDNIGKYVALDGVLVADAEANGGVKVIAFGVGTPTGVDSAIAEGTVAIYGTEGAVSVTGVTGTVELYDATGRLAKVAEAEGSAVIAMPAGYYIVRASGVAKAVIVK